MHELAVSQSIVNLVCQCRRREGFYRVTRVVVEVACGTESEMPHVAAPCPQCGAYGARVLRGRELRVKSLDGEYL